MKIVQLTAENVKRLQAVQIKPDGSIVQITGRNGQGKCVPEGTPVSLWSGGTKPIEDIRETDELVGLDPKTWRFVPEHPVAVMTSGVQQVFELRTALGHKVTLTSGHRILTPDGWTELGKMSAGQFVAVPMAMPCDGAAGEISAMEAMLIGMLIGDGCLTENGFTFACGDESVAQQFSGCVRSLFPTCVIRRWQRSNGGWSMNVSKGCKKGRQRGDHLEWLHRTGLAGHNAYTKFVPDSVFSGGMEVVRSCLAGLISTDGWVGHQGYCEFYSRSEAVVRGARALFLRLGIPTSLRERIITGKPFYKLCVVTGRGRDTFARFVLPLVSRSRMSERLQTKMNSPSKGCRSYAVPPEVIDRLYQAGGDSVGSWVRQGRAMSHERFATALKAAPAETLAALGKFASPDVGWDKIASIENAGCVQTFDLQMPSEAFIADEFIVHNSSVLDAIAYALGGKAAQPIKPIRDGADSASIVVDLGDIVVKRTWTANDKTYLSVETKAGAKYPSPQAILDKLVGQLTFDPLAFTRMSPRDQVATLKQVAGLDFDALDRKREELFTERTVANRDVKALEAQLAALPDVAAPDDEVSIAALAKQRGEAKDQIAQKQDLRRQSEAAVAGARQHETFTKSCLDEIEELKERIEELRQKAEAHAKHAQMATQRSQELADQAAAIADPDIAAIDKQIVDAEVVNRNVRAKKQRADKAATLAAAEQRAAGLTQGLEAIDREKGEALKAAPMPVPGLSFTADGVTFNGVPFQQGSAAEQLRVSVAMGFALNPKLRVMLVRDGSLLDANSLAMLGELATEKDGQVWLERVTDGEAVGIVIEDGQVMGAAKEAVEV